MLKNAALSVGVQKLVVRRGSLASLPICSALIALVLCLGFASNAVAAAEKRRHVYCSLETTPAGSAVPVKLVFRVIMNASRSQIFGVDYDLSMGGNSMVNMGSLTCSKNSDFNLECEPRKADGVVHSFEVDGPDVFFKDGAESICMECSEY